MLDTARARNKPTIVCTIYDAIPDLEPALQAGLCLFDDIVTREAARVGLPLIDLRLVCNEARDNAAASPIEPSAAGGRRSLGSSAGRSSDTISSEQSVASTPDAPSRIGPAVGTF